MKIVFYTLLFFLPSILCCQNYGGSNAEWIYDYAINGVTKVKAIGDTLVGTRQMQVLGKTALRANNDGDILEFILDPVYVNTDEGVVEFSTDLIHFDTLYNFQLSIGESWRIPRRTILGELTGDDLNRTVVDTFSLDVNGVSVYCQGVLELPETFSDTIYPNWPRDTIYQGIGSTLRYVLPFDWLSVAVDGGEGGILRCFSNDHIGVVNYESALLAICPTCSFSPFEYDCDQLNSVASKPTTKPHFRVFPNPTSLNINISSEDKVIESLSIYNVSGQSILNKEYNAPAVELDISNFPSGMYFILINKRHYEKLIIYQE